MATLTFLAIVTTVVVLAFDFTNGFHDSSNMVATVVASNAMTPRQAVVLVGTFHFLGLLLGATAVANTIGGVVELGGVGVEQSTLIGLAGLAGAIVRNLITWWRGLPSSS